MIVSARRSAVVAAAATLVLSAAPAMAGDGYGSARADAQYYDDPYGAEPYYGEAPRRGYERRYVDEAYVDPPPAYDPPYRPSGTVRDPKSFDEGEIYSKSFARPPYGRAAIYDECVSRRVVRRRLRREGWYRFRGLQVRGRVVLVSARRRPTGRWFDLAVDRCSGEILDARPLRPIYYDDYAVRPARPYWRRWR